MQIWHSSTLRQFDSQHLCRYYSREDLLYFGPGVDNLPCLTYYNSSSYSAFHCWTFFSRLPQGDGWGSSPVCCCCCCCCCCCGNLIRRSSCPPFYVSTSLYIYNLYIGAIYNMCSTNPYDMHSLLISDPYQQSQMSPLSGFSWKQEFWSENIDLQTECSEQTQFFISPENSERKAENLAEFCFASHDSQKFRLKH